MFSGVLISFHKLQSYKVLNSSKVTSYTRMYKTFHIWFSLHIFVDLITLHKKWSFPLMISSVNVTKSAVSWGFGHIYGRNPQWKASFFLQCKERTFNKLLQHFWLFSTNLWNYKVLNDRTASEGKWHHPREWTYIIC